MLCYSSASVKQELPSKWEVNWTIFTLRKFHIIFHWFHSILDRARFKDIKIDEPVVEILIWKMFKLKKKLILEMPNVFFQFYVRQVI